MENHGTVTAVKEDFPNNEFLRIRKLTPKECFRLQGLKDEDIDKVMIQQSNSSGYHLAGDSICVTCLMALYSTLFDKEWDHYINPKRWWRNE